MCGTTQSKRKLILNFLLGICACIATVLLVPKFVLPKADQVLLIQNVHPEYSNFLSPGCAIRVVSPDNDTREDYMVFSVAKANFSTIPYSEFQIFFNSLKRQYKCKYVTIAFDDGTAIEFVGAEKDEAYYGAYNDVYEVEDRSVKVIDDGNGLRLSTEPKIGDKETVLGVRGI